MFTSFSGRSSQSRSCVNPSFAKPTVVYSPTHGCRFIAPSGFIPQMPQSIYPKLTMGPFGSTIGQPDLELKLGLRGHTSTTKVASTKKVSKTNKTIRFSKKCSLTLGHRTWAKTYRQRGRPSRSKLQADRTPLQPAPIKVRPSKTQVPCAENQGSDGPNHKKHKKRDYYGPCVRCGKIFVISQAYASHMRVHYMQEETEEEKKERLAKKHRGREEGEIGQETQNLTQKKHQVYGRYTL